MKYDKLEPRFLIRKIVEKATAATLTFEECQFSLVKQSANNAITLPTAARHLAGCDVIVSASHNSGCTVVVTAGFHGKGSGKDTVTIAAGDAAHFICDGFHWINASGIASA